MFVCPACPQLVALTETEWCEHVLSHMPRPAWVMVYDIEEEP